LIFLDLDELLHIAERVLPTVEVRDAGLLGLRLAFTNDEAHELIVAIAAGALDAVSASPSVSQLGPNQGYDGANCLC
jgi:hypothetical protein